MSQMQGQRKAAVLQMWLAGLSLQPAEPGFVKESPYASKIAVLPLL